MPTQGGGWGLSTVGERASGRALLRQPRSLYQRAR